MEIARKTEQKRFDGVCLIFGPSMRPRIGPGSSRRRPRSEPKTDEIRRGFEPGSARNQGGGDPPLLPAMKYRWAFKSFMQNNLLYLSSLSEINFFLSSNNGRFFVGKNAFSFQAYEKYDATYFKVYG